MLIIVIAIKMSLGENIKVFFFFNWPYLRLGRIYPLCPHQNIESLGAGGTIYLQIHLLFDSQKSNCRNV